MTTSTIDLHPAAPVRRGFGTLMAFEALTFVAAGGLHLSAGQSNAGVPELIIAAVLAAGAAAVLTAARRARGLALSATWFALAGTVLGLSITASGGGPDQAANVSYHVFILILLITGLVALLRERPARLH